MPSFRFGPRPSLSLCLLAFGATYILSYFYQFSSVPGLVRYDESKIQGQEISLQARHQAREEASVTRETGETKHNVGTRESWEILNNSEGLFCQFVEGKRVAGVFPLKEVWDTVSREKCCAECQKLRNHRDPMKSCNSWSYCSHPDNCRGDFRKCELNHVNWPQVMDHNFADNKDSWTSGYLHYRGLEEPPAHQGGDRQYHTVLTAQGNSAHWQTPIAYYWFKKRKEECEANPPCDMGGFTRILHSGKPDDLMDSIPTFLADPLPDTHNAHRAGYQVLNRPNAILQWIRQAKIPERYVLMAEPDHLFLKPLPNMMLGNTPVAFGFVYIEAQEQSKARLARKFIGDVSDAELEKVAPIGSSPTMMTLEDLNKVVPMWVTTSDEIFNDQEANKAWGWILEMYAFTLSCYKIGMWPIHTRREFMAQPPFWPWVCHEGEFCPYHILHYTYDVTDAAEGEPGDVKINSWGFSKRNYTYTVPPKSGLPLPPSNVTNSLIIDLIKMLNEAMQNFEGWGALEGSKRLS